MEWANFVTYGGSPERRDKSRKRKKKRYAEDDDYRQRQIDAAKARYQRTKPKPRGRKPRGPNKPKPHFLADGRLISLLSAGAAAEAVGISKRTLISYEDKEVIPLNRLMDAQGRRWYPDEFIEFLKPLLAHQSDLREPLWRLKKRVQLAWQATTSIPVLTENP